MATPKRRSKGMTVLGIVLILVLLAEGALLVWFVRTRLFSGESAVSDSLPDGETVDAGVSDPSGTGSDVPTQDAGGGEADDATVPPDSSAEDPSAEDSLAADVPDGGTDSDADSETDPYAARAQELLAEMTTWEKVCQMFVITPESLTGYGTVTQAGEQTRTALADYPVGGLVYFASNLVSSDQVLSMISNTQSYAKLGLFITVDEEGGTVNRLMNTLGTTHFDSMYNYRNDGTQTAHDNAQTIGSDIAAYGFNVDFAPVADVWSNPDNTVIGRRAYSDDFAQAAELVAAAVTGFHDADMICTLKHFPGHGDTAEDSHTTTAYVNKTKEELAASEWLPFQAGIDAGADLVMIGHLSVPALDDVPASISSVIVTDILRGEMGFQGVVITDSMEMNAISSLYTPDELAVRAIEAGVDLLLEPSSFRTAANGVLDALESGRLSEQRIDESVLRILTLKLKYGILA